MKKLLVAAGALALVTSASAQSLRPSERQEEKSLPLQDEQSHKTKRFITKHYNDFTPENAVFSEDFENGIPGNWLNYGATHDGNCNPVDNAAAQWDYRGATGTLPATTGSQGAYGNPAAIIQSPTAANGFIILDSDFLDNAGTAGNFGGGLAPSPQLATLTSPVIDLTGQNSLVLNFYQYYRKFSGPCGGAFGTTACYIDFSTDGGATWPTSISVNDGVGVNSSTAQNDFQAIDISAILGGQSNAMFRFRWEGDYYFWMLDDISISAPPAYSMDYLALGGWEEVDFIIGEVAGSRMGINSRPHPQDWSFLTSIYNNGLNSLSNVQLTAGVIKDGAPYAIASSPVVASVASGDTVDYNTLNTLLDQVTISELGTYDFYYSVTSDSVSLSSDTSRFYMTTDLMSLDWGWTYNSIGSQTMAGGGDSSAIGVRIDFENADTIKEVYVGLGSGTQGGSSIIVEVYDSSGFTGYQSEFDKSVRMDSVGPILIDPSNAFQGQINVPLTQSLYLGNSRSVYIVVWMFTNGGTAQVAISNDQTVEQTPVSSIMRWPGAQWYSGYTNSRSFESPHIRAITSGGVCNYDAVIDSITVINANQGVYRTHFGTLPGTDYRVAFREVGGQTWRYKNIGGPNQGFQNINITPWFNNQVEVRLEVELGGQWSPGCETILDVPCKNQNLNLVVQRAATCATDSVLVRAGYAGGRGAPNFLWSNGATTKRTYADQGETLTVVVTDDVGCSVTDSITAPTLNAEGIPQNWTLTKNNATTFTGSWSAPSLPAGASLVGYRMQYRLRNTQTWNNAGALTTDTFKVFDFTGTGEPSGNYEFVARTRYNPGSGPINSEPTCKEVKGYNGSGNKTDFNGLNGSSSISIYPNPANDLFFVVASSGSEVTLMDLNGRIISSQTIDNVEATFDISSLASGVYMVRIQSNDQVVNEQIVKN
jgi:hypothetical protein